ncbi:MAG TPA: type VI secretion system membrane subunit TssM, partial [Chromatiales bacterium]|nr:type VI secretion system membrane subunit TssM [Chromatiales bacterium]HEX22083.1 type VI secretion system membrane subunit TssM [Chromatiales bacterium]
SLQMAGLKPVLESFIQKTFNPSRFENNPWLRGVYFTSGTQQGSPIDRVMNVLAGSFGLSLQALPAYRGRPRSYFINRFFRDILFQETELAGANIRYERQRLWLQRGAYAGALILTIVVIFFWATSFTRNELWMDKIEASVENYQQIASNLPPRPSPRDILQALQAAKEITLVYNAGSKTPWFMGMGLYQGYKLGDAAERAYNRALQQFLIPNIKTRLEDEMGRERRDPEELRQLLSIYMMLISPDTLDARTFRPWVEAGWQRQLNEQSEIRDRLLGHLDTLLLTKLPPQTPNQQLIARAQRVVCELPLTRQIYARLKQQASANVDDYDFTRLGKQITKVLVSKGDKKISVPGFYTFTGYHEILDAEGTNTAKLTIAENRRICEDKQDELATADPEALLRHVRNQYFDDYVDHWNEFLANIELTNIRNLNHAVETLETLSGRDSPLELFIKAVSEQTVLERAKLKSILDHFDVTKDLSKPRNAVERTYAPLHQLLLQGQDDKPSAIDTIRSQLRDLYDYTAEISDASDRSEAAFEAAKARMGQSKKDAIRELRTTARKLPKPVAGIVKSAATQSWGTVLGSARAYINTVWRSSVLREYRASIENRYPIFLKGQQQTALADFGNFFGGSGSIDNFTKTYLAPFVDTRRWRLRVVDERSLGLSNKALSQLKRAARIKEMFFQDGGNQVSVRFKLKPVYLDASVKRFLIDLTGKRLSYQHGPPRTSA